MNTFVSAIANQEARTENDMKARLSSASPCVDLFFKIGASRGKDITGAFTAAFVDNRDVALRIVQWARDVRQGAGERQLFRDVLVHLEKTDVDAAEALMCKVPDLGRWDDLLVLKSADLREKAFRMIATALEEGNGLCAKWMPRKGDDAVALRTFLGMSPKRYRKTLVNLTKVVETAMCSKDWSSINFSHVPSVASARYKKAFFKNATDAYKSYLDSLKKGDPTVKVNAGAVYPYDVIKTAMRGDREASQLIISQWDALPNYVGDANILPLVDVSGSMGSAVGGNSNLTAMDVAVSLGLYLADKNKGKFNGCFLTFSAQPQLLNLQGNILQKMDQMVRSKWDMNTNLHAAFDQILKTALQNNVPAEEMPETLLILSDMQFDRCVQFDDSAIQMIQRKYNEAGYTVPKVVFWNLDAHDNAPVKFNDAGVALISGFSPSIVKSVLGGKDFTPETIMLDTVMVPRYDV